MERLPSSRRQASFLPSSKPQTCCILLVVPLCFMVLTSISSVAIALLGLLSPPPLPTILKPLPWRFLEANGSFRSRCVEFWGIHPPSAHPLHAPEYFLAAVIFNRVFGNDRFGVTPYECKQWIEYMFYAGVEHVFWYDSAHSNAESQRPYLEGYIAGGLLTYHHFHRLFPGKISEGFHFEQDNSYRHFLSTFKGKSKWVVQMDVDEYPFSPSDSESCFLQRAVREFEVRRPNVTQILLQCMTFAGNPEGDLENGWLIENYQRRKYETEGVETGYVSRQKPIFRSDLCKGVIANNPHVVWMEDGITTVAKEERIRMNHYWGARESNFGPDTLEIRKMLVPDSSIQHVASKIKNATGLIKREDDKVGVFLRWMVRA